MLKFFIIFILSFSILFSQEKEETAYKTKKNPYLASLLGAIPGLGHIYLGEGKTAAKMIGSYLSFSVGAGILMRKPGYIRNVDRTVNFNFIDIAVYDILKETQNNEKEAPIFYLSGMDIYSDREGNLIFNEPEIQKKLRLLKNKQFFDYTLFELNPLLQYGSYNRFNTISAKSDNYLESLQLVSYYSFYSAFRDAGGVQNKEDETFDQLVSSPFRFKYLKDPKVWVPILWVLAGSATQSTQTISKFAFDRQFVEPEKVTLVNPGFHKSGIGHSNTFFKALTSGVGEEVFFRGFLYNGVANYTGKVASSVLVSTFFGSLHLYQGVWGAISATAFGLYTTYLYESYNQDLRPGIFLHFWWNTIVFTALMSRTYKEDNRVALNQREVTLSPVFYTYKF